MLDSNHAGLTEAQVRRQKAQELEVLGISPWPAYKSVNATSIELREKALLQGQIESTQRCAFSGRVIASREHGKSAFLVLQDRKGSMQTYFKQDTVGQESFERCLKFVDVGDIVWVSGPLFLTKTGEPTLKVIEWQLSSKCLNPLAEKHAGLTDIEQRYRQRYLDLICNRDSFEKFILRSKIIQSIRSYLIEQDFVEVETPMLHPIPGGAAARPFVTHHNTYDFDLYLRISPELYLKRLVVGGMERVFEVNRNFRNEGVSTKHNPEFSMLEFYMAHGDYKDGIDLTEKLIRAAAAVIWQTQSVVFNQHELDFSRSFDRLSVKEAIVKFGNVNLQDLDAANINATLIKYQAECRKNASYGEKLFAMFEAVAESKIVQPTFVIGYPIEVSPLAKRDPENPELAARFELFVCGMEIANGFTELNDPFDQAARFRQQAEAKADGDHEAHLYDAEYIHALEYGLPPTVGVGIGIDRLVMLLTNTQSIKDVILFPTLRPKKD